MEKICIYLRKSRADEELEQTVGQGETLSKHRKALLKFAKEKNLNIVEIKEEIVSGESLFFRPKMLELLKEVENKQYDGVLVMDMQRLGRGDMQEQGIILKTFKNSHTKIITPQKTYDLNNDFDEEYSEFEAFMSRKELKMINRRMQGGRIRSVEDGNYIGTNPPFGYDKITINKTKTLKVNESEANVVKIIFKMYTEGNGAGSIADYLNSLGYKSKTGIDFRSASILAMIKNPVYIGKVTWKKVEGKKSKDPNKRRIIRTRDTKEWIIADGKHEPLIDIETFNKAQEIVKGKYHVPYQIVNGAANPLAGIVRCGVCGSKMVMRKYTNRDTYLICNKKCGNKSAKFKFVEASILNALEDRLNKFKSTSNVTRKNKNITLYKKQLETLYKELETLDSQKLRLFDLLEQRVYSNEVFIERSNNISERTTDLLNKINNIKSLIETESNKNENNNYLKIKTAVEAYKNSNDISEKNELLKSILIKVDYKKDRKQRNDDFEIMLFPRL